MQMLSRTNLSELMWIFEKQRGLSLSIAMRSEIRVDVSPGESHKAEGWLWPVRRPLCIDFRPRELGLWVSAVSVSG